MRKIKNKLIVSDFDGTLIDDNQEVLPEVREKINEYIACGGIFAVCTGRMLVSILPRVRELGLKGLVIAQQGAVIADIESGELIKNDGLNCDETAEVCETLEILGQPVNIYSGDKLFTDIPKDNEHLKLYEKIIGVESKHIQGKVSEFVRDKRLFCQKVACLVFPDKRDELYTELIKRLGARYDVTCSARVLVEISKLGETKGAALKFLARYYSIPTDKTVAVGDNMNDLSMIETAGTGIAVGNADNKLKLAADAVTVTNNEGAVAQIIDKFGFE